MPPTSRTCRGFDGLAALVQTQLCVSGRLDHLIFERRFPSDRRWGDIFLFPISEFVAHTDRQHMQYASRRVALAGSVTMRNVVEVLHIGADDLQIA